MRFSLTCKPYVFIPEFLSLPESSFLFEGVCGSSWLTCVLFSLFWMFKMSKDAASRPHCDRVTSQSMKTTGQCLLLNSLLPFNCKLSSSIMSINTESVQFCFFQKPLNANDIQKYAILVNIQCIHFIHSFTDMEIHLVSLCS